MFSTNKWSQESAKYYITTLTVGDTELEIYGEVVGPEDDIGYLGEVDLHDIRIAGPDGKLSTSIWELVQCFPEFIQYIEDNTAERVL